MRQWDEVAAIVGNARKELEAEGKPAFIIAGHYGLVSEITFYLPEAKAAVTGESAGVLPNPRRFRRTSSISGPATRNRTGQSAVFVVELDLKKPATEGVPPVLLEEFESVTPLGIYEVKYYGRVSRPSSFSPAGISSDGAADAKRRSAVRDYDLAATLTSGQAFRWRPERRDGWQGVIAGRWVRLRQIRNRHRGPHGRGATTSTQWLTDYLQTRRGSEPGPVDVSG